VFFLPRTRKGHADGETGQRKVGMWHTGWLGILCHSSDVRKARMSTSQLFSTLVLSPLLKLKCSTRRTYPVIDDIDSLVLWEMLLHHVFHLAVVELDGAAAAFQALEGR